MAKRAAERQNVQQEAPPGAILTSIISTTELAELLDLSPQRIRQLKTEKVLVSADRNRWLLSGSVKAYLAYRERIHQERSTTAITTRMQDARADEVELRVLERSKALIKHAQDEALTIIDSVIGSLKADLYSMPARVTADLNIRHRIELEIDNLLTSAAHRAQEKSEKAEEE